MYVRYTLIHFPAVQETISFAASSKKRVDRKWGLESEGSISLMGNESY